MIAQASPFGGIRARIGLAHQEGPGQDQGKQDDGQPPRHNRVSHAGASSQQITPIPHEETSRMWN
jgi:hypothetical protein